MQMDAGVLLVMVLNGLAWVWGAGRLTQSVKSLEKTSKKLEEAVEKLSDMLGEHSERLAALEAVNHDRKTR